MRPLDWIAESNARRSDLSLNAANSPSRIAKPCVYLATGAPLHFPDEGINSGSVWNVFKSHRTHAVYFQQIEFVKNLARISGAKPNGSTPGFALMKDNLRRSYKVNRPKSATQPSGVNQRTDAGDGVTSLTPTPLIDKETANNAVSAQ
ncbi:MAG: hypothetical protein ACOYJ6_08450 [Caulobacterales bacterium]